MATDPFKKVLPSPPSEKVFGVIEKTPTKKTTDPFRDVVPRPPSEKVFGKIERQPKRRGGGGGRADTLPMTTKETPTPTATKPKEPVSERPKPTPPPKEFVPRPSAIRAFRPIQAAPLTRAEAGAFSYIESVMGFFSGEGGGLMNEPSFLPGFKVKRESSSLNIPGSKTAATTIIPTGTIIDKNLFNTKPTTTRKDEKVIPLIDKSVFKTKLTPKERKEIEFITTRQAIPVEFQHQDLSREISRKEEVTLGGKSSGIQKRIDVGEITLEEGEKILETEKEAAQKRAELEFETESKSIIKRAERGRGRISKIEQSQTIDIAPLVKGGIIFGGFAVAPALTQVSLLGLGGAKVFSAVGKETRREKLSTIGEGLLDIGLGAGGINVASGGAFDKSIAKSIAAEKVTQVQASRIRFGELGLDVGEPSGKVLVGAARRKRFIGADIEQEFAGALKATRKGKGEFTLGGIGMEEVRVSVKSTQIPTGGISLRTGRPLPVKEPKPFTFISKRTEIIPKETFQSFQDDRGGSKFIGDMDAPFLPRKGGASFKVGKDEFISTTGRIRKLAINLEQEPVVIQEVRRTTVTGRKLEGGDILFKGKFEPNIAFQTERPDVARGFIVREPPTSTIKRFKPGKTRTPLSKTFGEDATPPILFGKGKSIGEEVGLIKPSSLGLEAFGSKQITKQVTRQIAKQDSQAIGGAAAKLTTDIFKTPKVSFGTTANLEFGATGASFKLPRSPLAPVRPGVVSIEREISIVSPALAEGLSFKPETDVKTGGRLINVLAPAMKTRQDVTSIQAQGLKQATFQEIRLKSALDVAPPPTAPITPVSTRSGFGFDGFVPIPPIPFPMGIATFQRGRAKIKRGFKRTPSFAAVELDFTSPKELKLEFTGLVERPVIKKRRRK